MTNTIENIFFFIIVECVLLYSFKYCGLILYLNVFVKDDEHMGSSKWKRKLLPKKNGRENLNRDLT